LFKNSFNNLAFDEEWGAFDLVFPHFFNNGLIIQTN